MAGSSSQQTIANFVKGTSDLPTWAQPPATGKGSHANLPDWARANAPARKPSPLAQVGGGPQPQPTAADVKAQQAAQRAADKANAAQQKKAEKAAAQAQRAAAQRSSAIGAAAGNVAVGAGTLGTNLADGVVNAGTAVSNWASSWPTPGGIGLLLIVLFVLLWALIPVDDQGYTRLQLLWFTLMGRTQLHGSTEQQNAGLVAALSDTTSPLLGVSSLAQAGQGTTTDFSISPSLDAMNLTTY